MGGELEGKKRSRADVSEALPLQQRAKVAVGALGLMILVNLLALAADFEFLSIANRIVDGERVPFAEITSSDDHLTSSSLAQLVLVIVCAIAFLLWFSRAYRNAIAMGIRQPRYGPRGAVWWWFVPFANLVIPKKIANDVYRGSDPEMPYGDPAFADRPVASILDWWWAAWLLTGLLSRIASNSGYETSTTVSELATGAKLYIAADLANAIAAGLAIAVVLRITRLSEARRAQSERNPEPAEPPAAPPEPGFAGSFGPPGG